MMQQASDSYNQKNSLFNAMNRFIGAVNNMDQTVMVPSLLRDVPLDDSTEGKAPPPAPPPPPDNEDSTTDGNNGSNGSTCFPQDATDMYSSYVLLKSIRNDIEWGVLQGGEGRGKERAGVTEAAAMATAAEEEDDLEKQFHFHLNGLHTVLSKLTHKANLLTDRYKEEIGHCGR